MKYTHGAIRLARILREITTIGGRDVTDIISEQHSRLDPFTHRYYRTTEKSFAVSDPGTDERWIVIVRRADPRGPWVPREQTVAPSEDGTDEGTAYRFDASGLPLYER